MVKSSAYGRARGDFERASRAAFKTLERGQPESVVSALGAVTLAADQVLYALVSDMRDKGYSWSDVAAVLGVTRQSAWERFSAL